jgi:hypothetical protein
MVISKDVELYLEASTGSKILVDRKTLYADASNHWLFLPLRRSVGFSPLGMRCLPVLFSFFILAKKFIAIDKN